MKIFAFHFNTDATSAAIVERFTHIKSLPIDDRNMEVKDEWYRIESLQHKRDYWLLDFVKIRMDHGPGRGGLKAAVKGFDLDDDEGFCEETGVLFIPESKMMVVQYNHHGPRIGAIAEYLALFDHGAPWTASAEPVLDPSITHRLRSKTVFTKFEMTFLNRELTNEDYEQNRSLRAAAQAATDLGGNKVNIEISATGTDNTLSQRVYSLCQWALEKVRVSEKAVIKTAKVSGKDSIDGKLEILDLVAHRISIDEDIKAGDDKRYPKSRRWSALERSFTSWRNKNILE